MSYNTLYLPWIDTLDRLRGSHVPEAEALRPQVVAEFHCRGLAGGGNPALQRAIRCVSKGRVEGRG